MSGSKLIKSVTRLNEYCDLLSQGLCVVKFTATWCRPCKTIAPVYEKLATQYRDVITFIEVDIDAATKITDHENVQSIPSFFFYQKGQRVKSLTFSGANNSLLAKNLAELVATQPVEPVIDQITDSRISQEKQDESEEESSSEAGAQFDVLTVDMTDGSIKNVGTTTIDTVKLPDTVPPEQQITDTIKSLSVTETVETKNSDEESESEGDETSSEGSEFADPDTNDYGIDCDIPPRKT